MGEGAELQLGKHLAQGIQVGRFALERIGIEGDGHVGDDGRQPLGHAYLLSVLFHALLLCALEFAGMLQQVLDGAVLLDEFFGRLGAHTGASGDVVGGVAHQSQNVDELRRRLDAVFGIDLLDAHNLILAGIENLDVGCHQLSEVLVSSDHIGEESLLFGLMRNCADDVVGLEAFHFIDGDAVGFEDALDVGDCDEDALGRLLAVGLVGLVVLVTECLASRGIETHGYV